MEGLIQILGRLSPRMLMVVTHFNGRNYSYREDEVPSLPEVTLSAFTETGEPEPSTPVPKQKSYTGRYPVISSSVADTPCAKLGVVGLLEKLNIILVTSYTLEMYSLCSVLEGYITKDYDFGTAVSYLRRFWYNDLTDIEDKLQTRGAWDRQMRQDVLVNNKIINHLLPPRRVWDLYSNRVVPWWVAREYPEAISHAWMKEEDRVDVHTPINGREWPVPMPRDANLDLIRIEMLNYGAEYAWLDVLCLRQVGGQREDLRAEEWKVDVPTIGRAYDASRWPAVCYLSGLGRPFSLKEDDLESNTCWFKRAWTLFLGYVCQIPNLRPFCRIVEMDIALHIRLMAKVYLVLPRQVMARRRFRRTVE